MTYKIIGQRIFIPIVVIILTISGLWFTNRAVTPKEATWDDVVAEAQQGGYRLITTEELARLYNNDSSRLLLIDTRQDWEFATGHIKGAVNFSMEPTAWSRWQKKDKLAEVLGPDKKRILVFY